MLSQDEHLRNYGVIFTKDMQEEVIPSAVLGYFLPFIQSTKENFDFVFHFYKEYVKLTIHVVDENTIFEFSFSSEAIRRWILDGMDIEYLFLDAIYHSDDFMLFLRSRHHDLLQNGSPFRREGELPIVRSPFLGDGLGEDELIPFITRRLATIRSIGSAEENSYTITVSGGGGLSESLSVNGPNTIISADTLTIDEEDEADNEGGYSGDSFSDQRKLSFYRTLYYDIERQKLRMLDEISRLRDENRVLKKKIEDLGIHGLALEMWEGQLFEE